MKDAPIGRLDESGLGQESNNLAAIRSLTGYRAMRFGRHVELLITDQHSYRSEEPSSRQETAELMSRDLAEMVPEEMMQALDAGRALADAPATLSFGSAEVPKFRRNAPPQTILGAEQKAWLPKRLAASRATWKVWGNSEGTLDSRADPQNLPGGAGACWPGKGYACSGGGCDYGTPTRTAPRSTTSCATAGSPASSPFPAIGTPRVPAHGVRMHPAAAGAQRGRRRRSGSLSRYPPREALEYRATSPTRAAGRRGRPRTRRKDSGLFSEFAERPGWLGRVVHTTRGVEIAGITLRGHLLVAEEEARCAHRGFSFGPVHAASIGAYGRAPSAPYYEISCSKPCDFRISRRSARSPRMDLNRTPRLFSVRLQWCSAAVSSLWLRQGDPDDPRSVFTL